MKKFKDELKDLELQKKELKKVLEHLELKERRREKRRKEKRDRKIVKKFLSKHNFSNLDFRNLKRYEQVRAHGAMNMLEYLELMKKHNLNGGEKLANWIQSGNNYDEFLKVIKNKEIKK